MQKFRCLENSNKKEIKVEMFYAERRQDGKSDYVISGLQSSISFYICKVSGGNISTLASSHIFSLNGRVSNV